MNLAELSQKALNLTTMSGVYIMRNIKREIIYIGKAKSLKNRVSGYFQKGAPHNDKVRKMVDQVCDFDYIVCDSEFEALVLECSLIKQNNPKYNILLKDDKGYHYIKITKPPYSKITAEKQKLDDNSRYIGPYTSSFAVQQTVEAVNKIFKFPTCNRNFPDDFFKGRPCLNFHIKQCMGVCRGKISEATYADDILEALSYIKRGGNNLISGLVLQMDQASEALQFERAARFRDRINAIKKITQTQKVINQPDQDVVGFSQNLTDAAVAILKFRGSQLVDKEEYVFSEIYDIRQTRQEFFNQFYLSTVDIPPQILVDEEFEGMDLLGKYLTETHGVKTTLRVPVIGEQKKLVQMACQNASERLSKKVERTGREVAALAEITRLLGLAKTPEYIEAYDISNMGDSAIVGGMVVFLNGRPHKKAYKKFKIVGQSTQDDYKAMQEMLTRRFNHYWKNKDSNDGFGRLPDLILLDGGTGHLAAIMPVLVQTGIDVPIFGMVKDNKHKTRAIASNGGEISIASHKAAFSLITQIQDEVHRYSINYQRNVHKKSTYELTLTRVDGIGEKKAAALLKAFNTRAALKAATVVQLKDIAKVNDAIATELYDLIQNLY